MGLRDLIQRATRTLLSTPASPIQGGGRGAGNWYPLAVVREPYTGAWQSNAEIAPDLALSYFAVFSCTTLVASDIGKLELRLVEQDDDGIWTETQNSAYSPVLREPNHYQLTHKFLEYWVLSKLIHGNTYVLKERDVRGVVRALYILDPRRVRPLVTPDGGVYYELAADPLSGLGQSVTVPASELIHDLMYPLFHPLCGVSPLYAAGVSALQGQTIQQSSNWFFANGSSPGGVILVPGAIDSAQADRLKEQWEKNFSGQNVGRVAILSHDMKYEPTTINAVDSQLIDQLKWTADTICAVFHVPAYMAGIGPPPPYANAEPLVQLYYSQCLQSLIVALERSLDAGLELATGLGTELNIDDLIWMDQATRGKAAHDGINAGALSPDEARRKYYGLGPVPGGGTPYLQQQYWSLRDLDAREPPTVPIPAAPVAPVAPPAPAPTDVPAPTAAASLGHYETFQDALRRQRLAAGFTA